MSDDKPEGVKGWDKLTKAEQEIIRRRLLAPDVPKEQGKGFGKGKNTFNLKGYVRCELSAADKEAFKAWEITQVDIGTLDILIKTVDSGYLLKVGEQGAGYQASLCAATTSKEWDGYVLTAHASTAIRATTLLVYKHVILMGEDWSAWLAEGGEDFFR
jgi:hypothetical protein